MFVCFLSLCLKESQLYLTVLFLLWSCGIYTQHLQNLRQTVGVQCIIYAMQHLSQQHVCANALLHLLKLLCDHGERSEDAFCWSCDGDYSLWR